MSEETTPVPAEPIRGELVEYEGGLTSRPLFQHGGLPAVALQSWDATAPGGLDRLGKCLKQADMALRDAVGEVLIIVHIFVHVVEVNTDEHGAQKQLRTVLVDAEGNTYGTTAKGVVDSFPALQYAFGEPPWPQGAPMVPIMQKTRRGRITIILIPADRPPVEGS